MKFLVLSTLIFATSHATLILGGQRMVTDIVDAADDNTCGTNCKQFGEYQIDDGSCVVGGGAGNCATATTGSAAACGAIVPDIGTCTWTADATKHHVTFDWRPTLTSKCMNGSVDVTGTDTCGTGANVTCNNNDNCVATTGNAHMWVRGVREVSAEQAALDHVKFVNTAGVTVTREYKTCTQDNGTSDLCALAWTNAACDAATVAAQQPYCADNGDSSRRTGNDCGADDDLDCKYEANCNASVGAPATWNTASGAFTCQWTHSTGMHYCMVTYCTSGSGRCYTNTNLSAQTGGNDCCGGGGVCYPSVADSLVPQNAIGGITTEAGCTGNAITNHFVASGCGCSTETLCAAGGFAWDLLGGDNCYNGDERKCSVCNVDAGGATTYNAPTTCAKRRRALLGDRYEEHEEWLKTMKWTKDTRFYLDHAEAPEH